ncbi:MAG: SPOR domain-containing protein [Rubrivivax sp.]|nr:MAG: SPOR domain-containing protein [Rubrivivax sp.]
MIPGTWPTRALVVVLILANLGFLAWRQGWLDTLAPGGLQPAGASQREPERLQRQIHPERLIVVPAPLAGTSAASAADPAAAPSARPASSADAAASVSTSSASIPTASLASATLDTGAACYQAGPFTTEEHRRVSTALSQQLPTGSWTTQTVSAPGLWLVYMGPYQDPEMLERKQIELRRIRNLNFEEVRSPPSLAMGLSLGRFNQQAQAEASLETLRLRGVRTARVVTIRPAADLMVIRIPLASAEIQRRLPALPLPAGKGFAACTT